jgi:hypothetical protein
MHYYTISGSDNDSHMWGSADRLFDDPPRVNFCQSCRFKTDLTAINPDFRVKCQVFDLSVTYDHYRIASLRFKEACQRLHLSGVSFRSLPSEPTFFLLECSSRARFNAHARRTRLEDKCSACGFFRSVVGAYPAVLMESPSTDFADTDLVFGSGNARGRLLIASARTKSLLALENLRGLSFERATVTAEP